MIVTVSMGRTDFDLEHFPGRRRSSGSPDNLNVYSGGDETKPKIPLLNGAVIEGPEFLEFSLPYRAMQRVILDAKQDANKQPGEVTYPYLSHQRQSNDHYTRRHIRSKNTGGAKRCHRRSRQRWRLSLKRNFIS